MVVHLNFLKWNIKNEEGKEEMDLRDKNNFVYEGILHSWLCDSDVFYDVSSSYFCQNRLLIEALNKKGHFWYFMLK